MNTQFSSNPFVLQVIKARVADIERELYQSPLYKELKELQLFLENSSKTESPSKETVKIDNSITIGEYNKVWSLAKKAEFIIHKHGPLTTGAIADKIINQEPELTRSTVVSNLSAVLGMKVKEDKMFTREVNGDGSFTYNLLK